MRRTLRTVGISTIAGALGFGALLAAPAVNAAPNTIVIWVNQDRIANYREVFPTNSYAGYTIQLVGKESGKIRSDLATVTTDSAPDVIVGAHDWTGELAANGSIIKLNVPSATVKALAPTALNGFRYGAGIYGIPTQVENLAMITNKNLVPKAPKTFQELSTMALALKKAGKVEIPFAVQQSAGGDAYHMYPFETGLGGYVFGQNASGSVNVKDVGINSPRFQKNSYMIDEWNKSGLINSKIDSGIAQKAFTDGKAPFWVTGPWNSELISKLPFKVSITSVPPMVKGIKPLPFLGAQGGMVTKFAVDHGVQTGANALVTQFMASPEYQLPLAAADGRTPANKVAAAKVTNPYLKAFAAAGYGATPMPNVPQMASVWGALGGAWVNSTKGASAIPAAKSFAQAQATVVKAIG
ncbi:MAG: extracellular solute-binding protein [Candidatus Nanopelagicales bacterium]|nr:extracellular solute-binding protein [Candidatus Nanopelagicales bacterium]